MRKCQFWQKNAFPAGRNITKYFVWGWHFNIKWLFFLVVVSKCWFQIKNAVTEWRVDHSVLIQNVWFLTFLFPPLFLTFFISNLSRIIFNSLWEENSISCCALTWGEETVLKRRSKSGSRSFASCFVCHSLHTFGQADSLLKRLGGLWFLLTWCRMLAYIPSNALENP